MKQTYLYMWHPLYQAQYPQQKFYCDFREIIHTIYKSLYQLWCQNGAILKVPHQGETFEHHNSTLTIWTKNIQKIKRRIACHLLSLSIYIPFRF